MADHNSLRFGVPDSPNAPSPVLAERWRVIEELGFNFLWAPDHTADWRKLDSPWFDVMTTLATIAAHIRRVRIGSLVANPILRHPVVLRQAGRGRRPPVWRPPRGGHRDRHRRLRPRRSGERLLATARARRAVRRVCRHSRRRPQQRWQALLVRCPLRCHQRRPYSARAPQRPRPPITLGGQSPTVLRIATARADCWNTHGPFGATVEETLALTVRQNALLDELCAAAGRDPRSLRRSLLLVDALDAWSSPGALERVDKQVCAIGIREYTVFWPGDDRRGEIERAASDVIPRLRAAAA